MQGAAVIDAIVVAPASVADHVAVVAVFGNPSIRLLGGPLTTLSPLDGYKAIDLCNGAGPVCSDGNDVPAQASIVKPDWQRRQCNSSPTGSPTRKHR